jgi:putative ABC transport system permease protein
MEGAFLAAIGASVGIVLGIGYAYAMIALLKTWWVGAISVSFLDYYLRPLSLVMGWGITWIAAIGAIFVATRKLNHSPIASLLKGRIEELQFHQRPSRWLRWVGVVCAVAGVGTLAMGSGLQGQAQAGAFVGGGMLFMMFGLSYVWQKLKTGKSRWSAIPSGCRFGSEQCEAFTHSQYSRDRLGIDRFVSDLVDESVPSDTDRARLRRLSISRQKR